MNGLLTASNERRDVAGDCLAQQLSQDVKLRCDLELGLTWPIS